MDFFRALRMLEAHFDASGAEWVVVGGLALAVHGAGRLTHDVDIATGREGQAQLIECLEADGYETQHRSEGYSNHVHPDPACGRIDVVYVNGRTARSLFGEAHESEILPGVSAKVAQPEHLVAMKVLAMKNDPSRRLQEMADIAALLRATGIAPEAVHGYFEQHGLLSAWEQVRDGL